jgi:FAD/FMN-containing dehydrogenase
MFLLYSEQTPENLEVSKKYGSIIQKALFKGTGLAKRHIYVNYANGNESVAEIYGEPWRVQKLKRLKKQYDPNGRFNLYNPLTREE